MEDIELQLEALREIRGWGTWIVGIGGGVLGIAVASVEDVRQNYVLEIKAILLLGLLAFVCAIALITSVPSAIETLPILDEKGAVIIGFDLKGVYGYAVLGFLPMLYPYLALHASVSLIALILVTILWRKLFE